MTDNAKFNFQLTEQGLKQAQEIVARYPESKKASAVMGVLYLAQEQQGWISDEVIQYVAELLDMDAIAVKEVATFYTMYNEKPVGKYLIQLCRTTPCWLRCSNKIKDTCKQVLGIDVNQTTEDGLFTLVEVECLGACANAPVVQINKDYYEDLDEDSMAKVINDLRAGKTVKTGSQKNRLSSSPVYTVGEEQSS